MSDNKYTTLENMIRKVVREADENRDTEMRRKIKNVARPDDPAPNKEGQKLTKQAEIKNKIIDENYTFKRTEGRKWEGVGFGHSPAYHELHVNGKPTGITIGGTKGGSYFVKKDGKYIDSPSSMEFAKKAAIDHHMSMNEQIKNSRVTEVDLEPKTDDRMDVESTDPTKEKASRQAAKKALKGPTMKEDIFTKEELARLEMIEQSYVLPNPNKQSSSDSASSSTTTPPEQPKKPKKVVPPKTVAAADTSDSDSSPEPEKDDDEDKASVPDTEKDDEKEDLPDLGSPAAAAGAGAEYPGQAKDQTAGVTSNNNKLTVRKDVPKAGGSDSMSFGQAFAAARKKAAEAGSASTGQFTWRGKQYQTNVKGEKYVPMSKQRKVSEETILEADDAKIKLDDKKKTGNIKLDIEKPGRIPTSKAPVYVDPKTGASAARPQGNKPLEGEILPPEKKPKGVGSTATDFDAIRKAAKPSIGDRIKNVLGMAGKIAKGVAGKVAGPASPIIDAEPAGEKPEDLPVAKTIKKAQALKGQQRFRPAMPTDTSVPSSPGPVDRPDPYSQKDMQITRSQEGDCPPDEDCAVPSDASTAPAQKISQADKTSTKDMTDTDLADVGATKTQPSMGTKGGAPTKGGSKPPAGGKPPMAVKPPSAKGAKADEPKEKSGTWYYQDPNSDIVRAWGNTKDGEAPWKPQGAANKEKFTSPGGQLNVGPDTPNRGIRGSTFGKEKGPSVKDTSWKPEVSADFPGEEKPAKKKSVKESYTKENPMFKSDKTFGTPESLLLAAKEILEAKHKSEKQKELAAMGHPKDKITKKDVLIARGVLAKEDMFTGAVTDTKTGKKVVSPTATKADEKKPAANVPLPPRRPDDLKKEEFEQIDEISKKTAFAAYAGKANDDYSKDYGDKIHGMIKKKWGKKAGDDAEAHASAQYFGRGGKSSGTDKLGKGWNTPASSMRTTKSGKINKQDTKAKSSEIKSRLGTHPKAKLPEEIELSAEELVRLEEISKGFE